MKNVFICFILYSLFSCNKENNAADRACFTIIERQCATDPFNSYVKDVTSLEEKAKSIQTYLKNQGISGTEITANPPYTGAVCQACICPSGLSFQLSLSVQDTSKLKSLNLSLENKSCE